MTKSTPLLLFLIMLLHTLSPTGAYSQPATYCNPLNIDYAYNAIPDFIEFGKHRATADPVIVVFKGTYFLFSTNQEGYWWSRDMSSWTFVHRSFLEPYHHVADDLCAPAAVVIGDSLLLLGSAGHPDFPIWMSSDPTHDRWTEAVDSFRVAAWDPDLFLDDDGRLYLYYGSSNLYPIYGMEVDRATLQPVGERKEMIALHPDIHGWERFGEHADNTFLAPFIEGAWMTKHAGRYYLQYAAPGTEFSGYADGVYTANHPLGPFTYQAHNPFSTKPGGFARGAGHGATFQDISGHWWHVATIALSVKQNFERRIGFWPAGFDADGVLFCNTSYGDFPHYLGDGPEGSGNRFTGWMILNVASPVTVSSTHGGYSPNFAVDENIKTYWSAATGGKGEWLQSDLGTGCTVRAIQVNYADQDAEIVGRQPGLYHQYRITASLDGKAWSTIVDKSANRKDVPHDYVELPHAIRARFVRIENLHMPSGRFALSGFRVFGNGSGAPPDTVQRLVVLRGESERRNAWIKWNQLDNAVGYTIYAGIAPDKLYTSIQVFGANEYWFTGMDRDRTYFFSIEAFNRAGIGKRSTATAAD